jgi:hypothetical protein
LAAWREKVFPRCAHSPLRRQHVFRSHANHRLQKGTEAVHSANRRVRIKQERARSHQGKHQHARARCPPWPVNRLRSSHVQVPATAGVLLLNFQLPDLCIPIFYAPFISHPCYGVTCRVYRSLRPRCCHQTNVQHGVPWPFDGGMDSRPIEGALLKIPPPESVEPKLT